MNTVIYKGSYSNCDSIRAAYLATGEYEDETRIHPPELKKTAIDYVLLAAIVAVGVLSWLIVGG